MELEMNERWINAEIATCAISRAASSPRCQSLLWKGHIVIISDRFWILPCGRRNATRRALKRSLTDRLCDWYGISGHAHIWFSSYLQNRHQSAKIKDTLVRYSHTFIIEFHSALCWDQCFLPKGPTLHHSEWWHKPYLYADDTQIYTSLSVSNAKESLEKLQHW